MQYRIRREGDNTSDRPVDNWERNTLRDVLLEAYKEQRRARLWRNIWRGVAVVLFLILITDIGNNSEGGKKIVSSSGAHTAVINLRGAIGDSEFDDQVKALRESMEAAYKNKNAKAIVIRANSPGGSPVISNIAFNEIRRLKEAHKNIPVYVVAEEMCASGCYYIAAAADKIYADPSSVVGSIGDARRNTIHPVGATQNEFVRRRRRADIPAGSIHRHRHQPPGAQLVHRAHTHHVPSADRNDLPNMIQLRHLR